MIRGGGSEVEDQRGGGSEVEDQRWRIRGGAKSTVITAM